MLQTAEWCCATNSTADTTTDNERLKCMLISTKSDKLAAAFLEEPFRRIGKRLRQQVAPSALRNLETQNKIGHKAQ